MRKILMTSLSAIAVCTLVSSAHAAVINFGPAQNFTGPADVQTAGSVVDKAYDFDAGNLTINGVNFTDFNAQSADTHTGLGGQNVGYGADGFVGDYGTLLNAGDYQDGTVSSITLNGLTSGKTYQLEVWVNDGRVCCGARTETLSGDTAVGTGSVAYDTSAVPGQFDIGTFVATGTSQTLNLDEFGPNSGNEQINGLLLTNPVPEPASIVALAGLGGMGLIGFALRRRRVK
jgi:hypothetical protein